MEPKTHADLEVIQAKKIATQYKVKENYKTNTKDVDMTKRIVQSIANTYLFFDSDQDVLLPKSGAKTISEKGPESNGVAKIKNVKDHVISDRIGKPQVIEETKIDGREVVYCESKMLTTTLGNDQLIEYQEGVIDQHSIGFRYMGLDLVTSDDEGWKVWLGKLINPEDAEKAGYMFLVKEYDLFEWSPVSFGANKLSQYLGVKSTNTEGMVLKLHNRLDLLEKQLKSGKQSDYAMLDYELETRQLKQIISELFTTEPSIKATLLDQRRQREDTRQEKATELSMCPSCLKDFNHAPGENKCPDCGKFTDSVEVSQFDWGKALQETKFIKF